MVVANSKKKKNEKKNFFNTILDKHKIIISDMKINY